MKNYSRHGNRHLWQPAPGETVRVSIPAPAGANTATVFHFLEDPDNIKYALEHGHAQKVDISSAIYDKNYYILANAVKAYQDAYDSSKTVVVVEYFPNVAVQNGVVNIDAHGFSVFTSVPPADINATTPVFPDYGVGAQHNYYSVRPDEWIELTADVIIGDLSINSDYVEVIRDSNFGLFSRASIYIHVYPDIDTTSEKKFTVSTFWNFRNITFTIVPDFDYGNLYVGVVGHDTDFPNEVALHSAAQPDFYYNANGTLTTSKGKPNRLYPGTLINLDGVKCSNALVYNTAKTVYGIADNTGVTVTPFLKTGNNVGGDGNTYPGLTSLMASIKTAYIAYYAEQGQTLAPDDYLIVPYVIKHETIGSNVGWYVNFKVVKKDTFSLSYEYNEPLGFNAMEDIVPQKKPEGKSYDVYYSEENDRLEAEGTVMNGVGMTITKSGNNPDGATFVGWSTDPSAQARDYKTGVDDNWYEAGEKIIMTGDTTLYAIWSTNKTYTVANVQFQKLVATDKGVPYETNREFTFSVDSKFDGLQYAIFDEAGQAVGSRQTFSSGARSFKLKAKQYIVIYDVKNSNQQYVITETVPEGYSAPNGGVAYGTINATTNTSGQFILNFTNTIATYPITYNLGNGMSSNNPSYYTVEDAITLDNPTMKGYSFDGWSGTDLNGLSKNVSIPKGSTGPREYTAHWTEIPYTITYNTDGVGTTLADQSFTGSSGFTLMTPTAPEGYTFIGWKVTNKAADSNWSADRIYTSVNNGLSLPGGMYGNVTLTAQWDVTVSGTIDNGGKIEFVWDDYTDSDTDGAWSYSIHRGAAAGATITFTSDANYVINGVTVNGQEQEVTEESIFEYEVGEDGITEPVDIVVTTTRRTYTITWNAGGYEPDEDAEPILGKFADNSTMKTTTVAHGDLPVAPEVPSVPQDEQYTYTFSGWTPKFAPVTGSATYTAQYTRSNRLYTVVVKINPAQVEIQSQGEFTQVGETLQLQVPYNTLLEIIFVPKSGYKLTTATVNDKPIGTFINRFNDNIKGDTIIEVKSEQIEYHVSYDVSNIPGGGNAVGDTTADSAVPGATVELNTIEWTGNDVGLYKFAGWVADGNSDVIYQAGENFTMPEHDVTMTAVWHTRYTVSHYYSYNNKLIAQEIFYGYAAVGSEVKVFANNPLEKNEYVCKDENGSVITEAVFKVKDNGQSFILFEYTPKMYTITFKNADGSAIDGIEPVEYCVETADFTLTNPTRKGYTFDGWTGTGLDAATMTITIPKGSTGDREYTANWTPNVLTIRQSGVQPADTVLYQITGNDFGMTLPISGSKQVTIEYIPEGTYTIQEIGNWTWKYSGAKSATVNVEDGTGEAVFSFESPFSRWLHGEAHN